MASVFDFGSPAAGVGGSALASYLAARRLSLAEQAGDTTNALANEQLLSARRARSMAEAQPGDYAAIMGLPKQKPLGAAGPLSIAPQAPVPVTRPEAEAYATGLEFPNAGTMPVPRSMGQPTIAPAEATTGELPGRTPAEFAAALGPERAARVMSTAEGRAFAEKYGGVVTPDESARRRTREEAKKDAGLKFSEAHEAYLNKDNPEEQTRGLLLQAAAYRNLAMAVDEKHQDRLLKQADEFQKLYVDTMRKPGENRRAGAEIGAILEAFVAYKPGDPDSGERFHTALTSSTTDAGRRISDQISSQWIKSASEGKFGPGVDWDIAVQKATEARTRAGTPATNLVEIYREAAKLDPAAFAHWGKRMMESGKKLSAAVEKILGVENIAPDLRTEAHDFTINVDKKPFGSAGYYETFSKNVTKLTRERHRPSGTGRDWTRADALNERRLDQADRARLQSDRKERRLELDAIKKQMKDGEFGDKATYAALGERAKGLEEALQAIDEALVNLGDVPSTTRGRGGLPPAAAEATRPKPPQAKAPPAKMTTAAFQTEAKRLVAAGLAVGLSLEEAKAHGKAEMQAKGWTPK